MKTTTKIAAAALMAGVCLTVVFAQDGAPAGRGRGGPAQNWWVNKTAGGVYKPPMRPLWKLSELKKMHAGQNNWQEQIILDPEQDATYNSAAPGTKFDARMHPDTPAVFVVVAGQVHFTVEGQPPAAALGRRFTRHLTSPASALHRCARRCCSSPVRGVTLLPLSLHPAPSPVKLVT